MAESLDEGPQYSVNERAEQLMGRRLTPEQESGEAPAPIPIDYPVELGYQCPLHRRTMDDAEKVKIIPPDGGGFTTTPDVPPLLEWSEYRAFLWCPECDRDWPSALCVPLDGESAFDKNGGPDDAIKVYLDTVEDAAAPLRAERDQMADLLVFLNTCTTWGSDDPEDKKLMDRLVAEAENDEGPAT